MSRFLNIVIGAIIISSLFSCGIDNPDVPKNPIAKEGDTVSRTLIVYAMAENSLSNYLQADINEVFAAAAKVPDDCRLFAFLDNSKPDFTPHICRFYNNNGVSEKDTVFLFEKDFCSSDTAALREVLDMLLNDYPTESLDIVFSSHGSGWLRHHAKSAPWRSIGVDNGENSYSDKTVDVIEVEELAAVLENLPVKVDRLMFDACFMQTVETAYALRDAAKWIIASPAEIPGNGAPYEKLVPLFFSQEAGVKEIIDVYKNDYDTSNNGVVLSTVRCENMTLLADATYPLVKKYFNKGTEMSVGAIFSYLSEGYFYSSVSYPAFYDINAVMLEVLDDSEYTEWKRVFDGAVQYLNCSERWYTAVLRRSFTVDSAVCSGMSMYLPKDDSSHECFNADFATTEWFSAAGWNETGW